MNARQRSEKHQRLIAAIPISTTTAPTMQRTRWSSRKSWFAKREPMMMDDSRRGRQAQAVPLAWRSAPECRPVASENRHGIGSESCVNVLSQCSWVQNQALQQKCSRVVAHRRDVQRLSLLNGLPATTRTTETIKSAPESVTTLSRSPEEKSQTASSAPAVLAP